MDGKGQGLGPQFDETTLSFDIFLEGDWKNSSMNGVTSNGSKENFPKETELLNFH